MVILTICLIILSISLSFIKNNLNSSLIRRISAISFIYAGVLICNTFNIQKIGSGIGLYSGLFQVTFLSNSVSFFLLLVSAILIIIWPNFRPARWLGVRLPSSAAQARYNNNNNSNKIGFFYTESYNNVSNINKSNEYSLIILFNILGALFLVSSSDLISMYLSIELQSFGLYILATIYKEKLTAFSAGLKYFLLGARRVGTSPVLRLKPSNSGDPLKLLIPKHNLNIEGG